MGDKKPKHHQEYKRALFKAIDNETQEPPAYLLEAYRDPREMSSQELRRLSGWVQLLEKVKQREPEDE